MNGFLARIALTAARCERELGRGAGRRVTTPHTRGSARVIPGGPCVMRQASGTVLFGAGTDTVTVPVPLPAASVPLMH